MAAVGLAAAGAAAWWPDVTASLTVATAVLIVACPCALTLSAPITLGTAMGLLGTRGLYLKHPAVALDLSRIDTVAFDKTGTLTTAGQPTTVEHDGLDDLALSRVQRLAAESVHPTSRAIAAAASPRTTLAAAGRPRLVCEVAGEGLCGIVDGMRVAIGTAAFVEAQTGIACLAPDDATRVAVGERARLDARHGAGAARDRARRHRTRRRTTNSVCSRATTAAAAIAGRPSSAGGCTSGSRRRTSSRSSPTPGRTAVMS